MAEEKETIEKEIIREMIEEAIQRKAISLAALLETALDMGISMQEVGATLTTLLAFAIAWADETIQTEERKFLEEMKAGANILLSERGKIFHEAIFKHFLTEKPDSPSVESVIDFFRAASESDYWKSAEGKLLGFAMLSGFYQLAKCSGYPTPIVPAEEAILKRIADGIGIDYNEFKKLCEK